MGRSRAWIWRALSSREPSANGKRWQVLRSVRGIVKLWSFPRLRGGAGKGPREANVDVDDGSRGFDGKPSRYSSF